MVAFDGGLPQSLPTLLGAMFFRGGPPAPWRWTTSAGEVRGGGPPAPGFMFVVPWRRTSSAGEIRWSWGRVRGCGHDLEYCSPLVRGDGSFVYALLEQNVNENAENNVDTNYLLHSAGNGTNGRPTTLIFLIFSG